MAQNLEYGILRGETPELRIWPTTKKVTLAVRNILSLLPTFVQVRFYIFKYKYFIEKKIIYIYIKLRHSKIARIWKFQSDFSCKNGAKQLPEDIFLKKSSKK